MRSERDPIKIPGADEYHAPKEFRQDIPTRPSAKRRPSIANRSSALLRGADSSEAASLACCSQMRHAAAVGVAASAASLMPCLIVLAAFCIPAPRDSRAARHRDEGLAQIQRLMAHRVAD